LPSLPRIAARAAHPSPPAFFEDLVRRKSANESVPERPASPGLLASECAYKSLRRPATGTLPLSDPIPNCAQGGREDCLWHRRRPA